MSPEISNARKNLHKPKTFHVLKINNVINKKNKVLSHLRAEFNELM